MARAEKLEIYGLSNDLIAHNEAVGLAVVFSAYANDCPLEYIQEIGFNPNSGYVYIALENGVQICSMLGDEAEYLVTDIMNGEEEFFSSYDIALDQAEAWNPPYDED